MKKNNGFTLLELLVTFIIIGLLSSLAVSSILSQIPNFKVNEDIKIVEQALKQARSTAIKKSCTINADFSDALINNGETSGIIRIKDSGGTVLDSVTLNISVFLNTNLSTIENNAVSFDYRGQPLDDAGSVAGFDDTINTVAISYFAGDSVKATKSLRILPMTGNISD